MDEDISNAWYEQELLAATSYTDDEAREWYHKTYKIPVALPDTTHTCSNKCSFVKLVLGTCVMHDPAFICRRSLLIHQCGESCGRKIQDDTMHYGARSHEFICELTSTVVGSFICAQKPIETDVSGHIILASRYDMNVSHANRTRNKQDTVKHSIESMLTQLFCKPHVHMVTNNITPIPNLRHSKPLQQLRDAIIQYYNIIYVDTQLVKNEMCIFCIVCLIHCKMGMTIGGVDMFPVIQWIKPYFPNAPNEILKLVVISKSNNRMHTKVKKITSMSSRITSLMIFEDGVPNTRYIFTLPL